MLTRFLAALSLRRRRDAREAARTAATRADEEYRAASERLEQEWRLQSFDHDRAEALATLSGRLYDALMLRVNEIIDDALDASYERGFSYEGSARLTDQLDATVQAPVSIDAFWEIRGCGGRAGGPPRSAARPTTSPGCAPRRSS